MALYGTMIPKQTHKRLCTDHKFKYTHNLKVIYLSVSVESTEYSFLFSTFTVLQCYNAVSPFLFTYLFSLIPLLRPTPLPPPLDILSYYKAWFGSLVCVHVVPLCKRPRLKLCGKSSASFLNTPSITVQGLRREGGRGKVMGRTGGKELREVWSWKGRVL